MKTYEETINEVASWFVNSTHTTDYKNGTVGAISLAYGKGYVEAWKDVRSAMEAIAS